MKDMYEVKRFSPFSGKENTMTLNMSESEFKAREARWQNGALIQDAFDNLNADEREFVKTGITPSEWDNMFK